jgi:hypothetical protein
VTVYNVSYDTHISRRHYDMMYISNVMRSAYMLIVYNHMNLVRNPRRAHMYLALCYVLHMSRRDHHVMMSRSPIRMMRRSRS